MMTAITKEVRPWKVPAIAGFTISIAINIMSVALSFGFGYLVTSMSALVFDKTGAFG
jgi:hypothetical protein